MDKQDKVFLLLSVQEHPERYTNDQLAQMFKDVEMAEGMEQLSQTKRAFVKRDLETATPPVDEEWNRFATAHADELNRLGGNEMSKRSRLAFKAAASFVGFLFAVGLAYAAICMVHSRWQNTVAKDAPAADASFLMADTIQSDTPLAPSVVFDNVPLETMLTQIAAYYQAKVDIQNADVRRFRFYFVWKPEASLDSVLQRLNRFESLNVEWHDLEIVVK
ncbi:MAG: DUF4974 domain-containing protein [Bacteroidaceae bacterium]|nr:DUF4974 domain-containing protein [Bacteroidaceae bacterium]